jgi:hypothetical protein
VKLTTDRHYIYLNLALEELFGTLTVKLFVYLTKHYSINEHGGVKAARPFPDIGNELHNPELPDLFQASNIVWTAILKKLKCVVFVAYLKHTKNNLRFWRRQIYLEEQ